MPKRADPLSRLRRRFKNWLQRSFEPWRTAAFGGIRVHFKEVLDGGGSSFGQDFVPFLTRRGMPKQQRAFEWCAGPGFIGFSLLGHGLCETLCLADINPKSVAACRRTVAANRLGGKVSVYRSDNLSALPAEEQWNLIVSNPPHFDRAAFHWRAHDPGWNIHRAFFDDIGRHLRPGGIIVLQENHPGSTAETFRAMIEAAGLEIVFVDHGGPQLTPEMHIYYLGIMRRGDARPAWVIGELTAQPA